MGGFGTWQTAIEYPDRFAAIAPICGGGLSVTPYFMERLKNVPAWAFHDQGDDVVPYKDSVHMIDGLNNAGGNAKLTTYSNNTHDSWTETYNNPKLYEWLLIHKNKSQM